MILGSLSTIFKLFTIKSHDKMVTFTELRDYVSEYWRYEKDKIKQDTTLDEIGMYGDDKYDFLIDLAKKFNLDLKNFPFDNYVDDEIIDPFGLRDILLKFFGKTTRRIEPITIEDLVTIIKEYQKKT